MLQWEIYLYKTLMSVYHYSHPDNDWYVNTYECSDKTVAKTLNPKCEDHSVVEFYKSGNLNVIMKNFYGPCALQSAHNYLLCLLEKEFRINVTKRISYVTRVVDLTTDDKEKSLELLKRLYDKV